MIRPLDWVKKKYKPTVSPPLGLMSLAAWAREERPGKDVFRIVNEYLCPMNRDQWGQLVRDWRPDCIAFSAMNLETARLQVLVRHFKKHFPRIPLIAGGSCVSSMGSFLLEHTELDAVFRGEGEVAFVQWLDAFEKEGGCPITSIPGMVYRGADGAILDNGGRGLTPEIDTLPIPAWDLVDLEAYRDRCRMTQTDDGGILYATLFSSRGCPYQCIYCHSVFPKKFRALKASRVVDEIQFHVENHGVRSFEVFDDIFNLDYNRAMDIFTLIRERGLDIEISFPNGVRGDILDEPMIRAMKQAGVYSMAVAVETATPRIQKMIKKNVDLKAIRQNIRTSQEAGIFVWGFFMLGFPGETFGDMMRTIWFAVTSRLHGAFFFSVVPFEGTELSRIIGQPEPDGIKAVKFDYLFSPNRMTALGATGLSMVQFLAFVSFFASPSRLWRIYRDWPRGRRGLFLRFCKVSRYLFWDKPFQHYSTLVRYLLGVDFYRIRYVRQYFLGRFNGVKGISDRVGRVSVKGGKSREPFQDSQSRGEK